MFTVNKGKEKAHIDKAGKTIRKHTVEWESTLC